jgi:hypothetical protein
MSLFSATGSPNSPFNWPRNTDPQFVSKTSDVYEIQIVNDPILVLSHIPSLYATTQADFNISIAGTQNVTVLNAQLTSLPAIETDFTFNTVNNTTVRIQGLVNSFPGELFSFKLEDDSIVSIEKISQEPEIPNSVIEWRRPNLPWSRLISYSFNITYNQTIDGITSENLNTNFTVNQYVYWDFDPSLTGLKDFVERSLR